MTLMELIARENHEEGPFPTSGGVIHLISPQVAEKVAIAIANAASSWAVPIQITCAFVRGEGNFDPNAQNPNLELAPNHAWPTPEEEAAHTDYGLCQINGDGSYLGINAIDASLNYLCKEIITNVMWAAMHHLPIEVAYEAYNKGRSGALAEYNKLGGIENCPYGRLVDSRVQQYLSEGLV